jgi:hypothetical protein
VSGRFLIPGHEGRLVTSVFRGADGLSEAAAAVPSVPFQWLTDASGRKLVCLGRPVRAA